ncbi:hypothetical protein COCMIDRAFT_91099 [Bipolaris oryzae ATCC 44560]|uniref:Uncharacterized protein n=1 Tax=Bipolaris oryzae ATCC 44560 TaxID=930090 RepID=W6ZI48_COCMI|nr:uncharacterized protein COCMIDRAFT_91099 [Bipolaris oryzae ATCC 44560]EUC47094.1 hypothetical protein COCMIDRAFT_91099 [Bipolaris oryzae ATCC 44560]
MVRAKNKKKTFAFVTVSSTVIHTVPTTRTTRRERSGEEAPSHVMVSRGLLAAYTIDLPNTQTTIYAYAPDVLISPIFSLQSPPSCQ